MFQKAAILGCANTRIGKHADKTVLDLAWDVFKRALEDAKIKKDQIEGLYITPEGFGAPNAQMLASRLTELFNLQLKSSCRYELGGTSSSIAFKHAVQEIQLGRCEVCAVLAAEKNMSDEPPDDFHTFLASTILGLVGMYGPYDAPYGVGAPVPFYAMSTQRYMHEYGVTAEQVASAAVILREHASKNPDAEFQKPITVEDVLNSRVVSPPVHLLECSKFSDGAACVVLASEEFAKKHSNDTVFVTGLGEFHDATHFLPKDPVKPISEFLAVKFAAKEAFASASRKPEDMDLAEIYGVFAGQELMVLEDIGFFKKGEGGRAAEKGLFRLGGQIPVDISGGRLSLGHPATVTPLLEIIEIVRQLKGLCGERQVNGARRGLVHAEHGMLNGSMVMILER